MCFLIQVVCCHCKQPCLWNDTNDCSSILHTVCYPLVSSSEVCVLSVQAEQLMKRIGVEGVKLTEYEMNIASHLVDPQTMKVTIVSSWCWNDLVSWHFWSLHFPRQVFSQYSIFLQVSWRDIAGLDEVINELQDTVILPFQKRHLLAGSKLFQPPKGTTACHLNRTIMLKFYIWFLR